MVTNIKTFAAAISIASTLNGVLSAPIADPQVNTAAAVQHWGSGCPQDTSQFSVHVDGNRIVSNFGSFDVTPSPQANREEVCGISVQIAGQPGRQFSPTSTSYCDALDVSNSITATHLMTYTFQGTTALASTRHDYVGPVKGTYDVTDTVPGSGRVWSACGATSLLIITNRGFLSGSGSGGSSYFNTGDVVTNLEWRSC